MTATTPVPRKRGKREVWAGPVGGGLQALIIGTAILIATGGGTHPLTLGLLTLWLGLVMVVRPPAFGVGRLAGLCWAALCIWILLTLCLPAPAVDWRLASDALGIPIGSAITPQPWVTLQAFISFLAGSALLLLAHAHKPDPSQRQRAIHLLAFVLTALAVAAIVAAGFGWRLPWADEVHVFSWFPNRNQTALTFACGSVLLFGLAFLPWHRHSLADSSRKRVGRPPPRAVYTSSLRMFLGGCVLLYATFQSLSRGALIAWSGGMLTLIVLRAVNAKGNATQLLRFIPALGLLLFSFFVFFGGDSRDRMMETVALHTPAADDSPIPADFRWHIYSDTTAMIADQPLVGVGLGQFRYLFPQYRSIPAAPVGILHPESDWLWWAAELGLVGLALIVLGTGSLLLQLRRPSRKDPSHLSSGDAALDRLYRHSALAALVPFFVHSLVDVGAHRLGTVALALILYALALPQRVHSAPPRQVFGKLWRISGIAMGLIGSGLILLVTLRSPLLTTYAPGAKEPLATAPLQWQPYFRSASQIYPVDRETALNRFYQARFLMADSAEIPFQEGLFLLRMNDHGAAFAAFRSAIQRSDAPVELFRQILRRTVSQTQHHPQLYRLAQSEGALVAAYWSAIPGKLLKDATLLDSLIIDWPDLPESAQHTILRNLHRTQQIEPLLTLFERSRPQSRSEIWPVAMQALVAANRWQEALALFDQWVERRPLPDEPLSDASLRQLQASALMHSDDPVVSGRLLNAYLSRRMWDDARRTATRIRDLPNSPPDTLYWLGLALSETNRPEEAARAYAEWLSQLSE